jgi:hypothetical protein
MKNMKYLPAALLLLLGACIDDKGNYAYTDAGTLAPAAVSGISAEYTMQMMDTLRLAPTLAEGASEEDHDFLWYIYTTTMARDTISRERELSYLVTVTPALDYRIALQVTNKKTGLYKYYYTILKVVSPFDEGWYVTKDTDGVTDIDLVYPDGRVVSDLLAHVNGEGVPGEGIACADARKISVTMTLPDGRDTIYGDHNCLYVTTRSTVQLYDIESMSLMHRADGLFIETPERLAPGGVSCTPDVKAFFNDSVSYAMDTRGVATNNIGKWGAATPGSRVDPTNMVRSFMSPILVFDPDSRSFKVFRPTTGVYAAIRAGGTGGTPDANNMDYSMIFMKEKAELTQGGVAIMKKLGEERYYGVTINGLVAGLYGMWENPTASATMLRNPIANFTEIPSGSNVLGARLYGTHRNMNVLYFSRGDNEVWYYNLTSGGEEKVATYPAGEQVTYVHTIARYIGSTVYNLAVLTSAGGDWKLYIYDYQPSSPLVVEEPVAVYSGQGTPRHVFYRSLTSTTSF